MVFLQFHRKPVSRAPLRLWKLELQKFADESGLTVSVSHFPPEPASGIKSKKAKRRDAKIGY